MTPISTGSTLMPIPSSHLMAALTSGRGPLNSRQMMPIASVTLAWRTLVTTANLRANSQITGVVINLGGYMSQRRNCAGGVAALVLGCALDFLAGIGAFLPGLAARLHPPAMAGMMLTSSPSLRAVSW